jgi:hypothetical protein
MFSPCPTIIPQAKGSPAVSTRQVTGVRRGAPSDGSMEINPKPWILRPEASGGPRDCCSRPYLPGGEWYPSAQSRYRAVPGVSRGGAGASPGRWYRAARAVAAGCQPRCCRLAEESRAASAVWNQAGAAGAGSSPARYPADQTGSRPVPSCRASASLSRTSLWLSYSSFFPVVDSWFMIPTSAP